MRPVYREFIATGLALALGPAAMAAAGEPTRPNFLFVAVDDLRPEFGAYGHVRVKSPNLDRLAARGMVSRRACCQQPAVERYDHLTDPREDRNVADDPANAELIERLTRRAIAGWREARPARP